MVSTGLFKDEWPSLKENIQLNLPLSQYARPGAWNDPGMLEIDNGGMTDIEYRTHFSMWAIMAAPLLIGTDLQKASPATFEILLNRDVIAVDQDPLGVQGTVVRSDAGRSTGPARDTSADPRARARTQNCVAQSTAA